MKKTDKKYSVSIDLNSILYLRDEFFQSDGQVGIAHPPGRIKNLAYLTKKDLADMINQAKDNLTEKRRSNKVHQKVTKLANKIANS